MKITKTFLLEHHACSDQMKIFLNAFPEGAEITRSNIVLANKLHLDLDWLAIEIFTAPPLAEYEKVRAPALAEYEKVMAPALTEYEKVIPSSWAEYLKVRAPALAEYEKVIPSAWDEYLKVRTSAFVSGCIAMGWLQ